MRVLPFRALIDGCCVGARGFMAVRQNGGRETSGPQGTRGFSHTRASLLNQTFQRDKSESFNDLSSAVIPKEKQIQMK